MAEPDRTEVVPPDAPLPAMRMLAPGSCLGERYEVRRVLGVGGYAVVYLAFDRELRREVALKVLRTDRATAVALARLRREAAVARDAVSPRLVRIFELGVADAMVYLVLEVVEGESLRERLTRGPLAIDEAVRLTSEVLEGLTVLHASGIVHRDVKPGNILLTGGGEVKLADFGLARNWRVDETRMTAGEGVLGTIEYLSPEQALGEETDARSDLYSAGVVLFEMLAGELPHPGKSSLGTVLGKLRTRAPDVRRLRPEVPSWLAALVACLLEKERSRRYASAGAVAADLAARSSSRGSGWRRLRTGAAGLLLTLLALAMSASPRGRPTPAFSHLVPLDQGGVMAVDIAGRPLWSLPGCELGFNFAELHLRGDSGKYLAAILRPPGNFDPQRNKVLSILDAETGRVVKRIPLPSAAGFFPGFSNTYGTVVRTFDLDHDGTDEVLVSYGHSPYWPSFTVLCEPIRGVARILFIGSGHHRVVGAQDLDGDGRAEVILAGINNRMGWYSALAAVKVVPWVGEALPGRDEMPAAFSPDYAYPSGGSLLWYALGPRAYPDMPGRMDVLRGRRALAIYYQGKPAVEVGFDGFLTAFPSRRAAAERQAARKRAYGLLLEASRLQREGLAADALPECREALQEAGTAADPYLQEWISRELAKTLVAAGRAAEGEALFRRLASSLDTGSEAAYDAARTFHLAGQLERAVEWYRRGLGRGAGPDGGRGKYEYLEGLTFALGEMGRWEEALSEVERYDRAFQTRDPERIYREYIRWRMGDVPSLAELVIGPTTPDLGRYWQLEFRWARHEDARALLAAVEEERKRSSETPALLSSLQGELLARLGRTGEALAAAREALRQTRSSLGTSPASRAHYDLVAGRFAIRARAAGLRREAAGALHDLLAWQRQRAQGRA